jgi:competence protein ComGC
VGEIVLVVIGILIALWINNLNEERKTENAQKVMLISFSNDLSADASAIKDHLDELGKILEVHHEIYQIRKNELNLKDLKNPGFIRGSVRYGSIVLKNNPDFGSKVTNPDIKEEVLTYYQLLSRTDNSYAQYDNVIKDVVRPYMREHILMNEDFDFLEEKSKGGSMPVNMGNFGKVMKREDFGQILIEASWKALELSKNFEDLLEANEKLHKSITIKISDNP